MIFKGENNTNKEKQAFLFVEEEPQGTTRRFVLQGRVSVNEASVIESKLERTVQEDCKRIIINMSLVDFFSSAGIRVILAMYKKLKKMDGELKIENPSDNVKNVIGMVALDELLLR